MGKLRTGLAALTGLLLIGAPSPALAVAPQITDPALDHPAPFADLLAVTVSVAPARTGDRLEVAFKVAGAISPESRNAMTGYNFRASFPGCELAVGFNAFPSLTENAGLPAGSSGAQCGAAGREITGTFRIKGDTVVAEIPLRDLKGVSVGGTMKKLVAWTAPVQGFDGDDTGTLAMGGDRASSDKTWTLQRG